MRFPRKITQIGPHGIRYFYILYTIQHFAAFLVAAYICGLTSRTNFHQSLSNQQINGSIKQTEHRHDANRHPWIVGKHQNHHHPSNQTLSYHHGKWLQEVKDKLIYLRKHIFCKFRWIS
ncbi:hypothetical protein SAMN05421547_101573 [Delftia lacustris]|uniref:Uncharacterized protein n=1 Tax=Delftia lacustris TaxID=558537 RepID=A0A1H3FCN4_9BURK|nr:hypothetical protein SAMN05421547_101573 [Delftia lacustris]